MPLIPTALHEPIGVTIDVLRHVPFGPRLVTEGVVALLADATEPRPRPLSLAGDYTSWISLNDRSFSGRHLPPPPPGRPLPPAWSTRRTSSARTTSWCWRRASSG